MIRSFIFFFFFVLFTTTSFSQSAYTFIGNGKWGIAANWSNNTIPPNPLPEGSIIYISPLAGDSCVLDVAQTISKGASLIIGSANFIISGGVIVNNNIPSQPGTAICNQVWMTKNLMVSAYRNGDLIPEVTNLTQWNKLTTGAWCWYNNDSITYSSYGKLYNWYAVNDPRGLAPLGWRIPNTSDMNMLDSCYGKKFYLLGGVMKETGTQHWISPNKGATNISGFTALPCGQRDGSGFIYIGERGFYWLSQADENISDNAYMFMLDYNSTFCSFFGVGDSKKSAHSVRCVKDTVFNLLNIPVVVTAPVSSVTSNTAVSGGNISSDGGYPVIEKGMVWDTIPNPTIAKDQTSDGNSIAAYISNITNLSSGKTYYVRAFVRNQFGVGYGNNISFTTQQPTVPLLSTFPVVFFKDTSAYGGGKIENHGGSTAYERGVVFSTTSNPTISDGKSFIMGGIDSFTIPFSSLLPNTTYYVKAYGVNAAGVGYGNEISFKTASSSPGNVIISNQLWTPKNLDVSFYRNGDPIPQVTDAAQWAGLTTGAWCWYNNDSATYAAIYGKLYNWYAVNDPRGLAPTGWHIPNETEWSTLNNTLTVTGYVSIAFKDTGSLYWASSYPLIGNNISGFTALPGGYRSQTGQFAALSYYSNWWSSDESDATKAYGHYIGYMDFYMSKYSYLKLYGFSVRCIKD